MATFKRPISFTALLAVCAFYVLGFVVPPGAALLTSLLGGAFPRILLGAAVKTVPVAALGYNALAAAKVLSGPAATYARYTAWGLFLGSAGDLALDLLDAYGEWLFMVGLGSFLLSHVAYIVAARAMPALHSVAVAVPFVLLPIGLVSLLWAHLPADLVIPVCVYATAIATMGYCSAVRSGVSLANWSLVLAGSLSFLVSDAILALDKFRSPLPHGKVAVMVTYYAAQMLTARGVTLMAQEATSGKAAAAAGKKKQ